MKNILCGVCYYPEHWDEDRLGEDIRIMKDIGINVVRIGEFAWSVIEKESGKYDFSFFDKVINKLHENDISVIIGTPTASPPAWLVKKHPDILQRDETGNIRHFGSRRHYCFNSDNYLKYAERITDIYAQHFSRFENVISWQIDNEYGCHETTVCYCENCAKAFRKWLKKKYGDIKTLNNVWGTVFWSHIYNNWDEIEPPLKTVSDVNPAMWLDYQRFSSDSAINFHKKMTKIIRDHSKLPITHNLMVNFTEIDYKKLASEIDFVCWDNYIPGKYDPDVQAMNHDLIRSLKDQKFVVMEQQPGRVNWRKVNEFHRPEQLKFWIKQSFAHGANGTLVFRYRQLPYGSEQFHSGLIDYSGEQNSRGNIFKSIINNNDPKHYNYPKKEVAIYLDYENFWIDRTPGINNSFNLLDNGIYPIYKAIRNFGYNVDFVFTDTDLSPYKLLVVPSAYYLNDSFLEKLSSFKGKIIITAMTSLKDRNNNIQKRKSSLLNELIGVKIKDFGGIDSEVSITYKEQTLNASYVCELLSPINAEIVTEFSSGVFESFPAITRKNNTIYVATIPNIELSQALLNIVGLHPRKSSNIEIVLQNDGSILLLNPFKKQITAEVFGKKIKLEPYQCKHEISLV
ncbi:MAG: beta-galactosidase [Kosmotogaceae bacterium]